MKNKFNVGDKVVVVSTEERLAKTNLTNVITALKTGDLDIAKLEPGMIGTVMFYIADENDFTYFVEFGEKHACCMEEDIKAFDEENKVKSEEEPKTKEEHKETGNDTDDEDDYCLELKVKKVGNRFVGNLSGADDVIELIIHLIDRIGFEEE